MLRNLLITLALVIFAANLGCRPADQVKRYQVPQEHRTVEAKVPSQLSATGDDRVTIPQRMVAAILPHGDQAWFVKAMGPVDDIAKIADDVQEFVKSWQFDDSGQPKWVLPANWNKAENANSLRFATLKAGDVEISVSTLGLPPGDRNQYLLMNINRWRGQLGLPPITVNDIAQSTTTVTLSDGTEAVIVDITGRASANGARPPFASAADSTSNLANNSEAPTADSSASEDAPSTNSNSDEKRPNETTADDNSSTDGPYVPSHWKPGRKSAMRLAAYVVENGGKSAEITVIGLVPSDFAANVNRWRQQIGLPPESPDDLEKEAIPLEVDGTKSKMVVLKGADDGKSIAAVIVPKPNRMWFVKMMGDTAVVLDQLDEFKKFAASLNFK